MGWSAYGLSPARTFSLDLNRIELKQVTSDSCFGVQGLRKLVGASTSGSVCVCVCVCVCGCVCVCVCVEVGGTHVRDQHSQGFQQKDEEQLIQVNNLNPAIPNSKFIFTR